MTKPPVRVVIEGSRSVWDVSCFASDHGLIFHSSIDATDDVPAEVIWVTRSGASILHRIEDQFAELTYLLCGGEDAQSLASAAVDQLDGIDGPTLLLAMQSRDDTSLSDPSIASLGVLAPPAFDPAFFQAFQWVLHHASAQVRRAAIKATTYPAWPELASELDQIVDTERDDDIRGLASRAAALLKSRNAAAR